MCLYDEKIIESAKSLTEESQKEKFPYFMKNKDDNFELKIRIDRHVFSPKYFKGYKFFIPYLPDPKNKKVLEIGCGHGIISCFLASKKAKYVLATDINAHAVKTAKENARLNKLKNIEVIESDVFKNIEKSSKFDIIFWNTPWAIVPREFRKNMTPEDYGVFDPEYKSIAEFILKGKKFLTKNGHLYLGFGVEGANTKLIEELIQQANLSKKVIADDLFEPGEKINGKLIKFQMKLYELS